MRIILKSVTLSLLLQLGTSFTPAPHQPSFTTQRTSLSADATTTAPPSSSKPSFDLNAYIAEKKPFIEEALKNSIISTDKNTEKICESMAYSLMAGGKRIRPVMCIAACEMFGGDMETAMPCAVSLEMIHTMSLIHDDLPSMDDDDLRRGKPTNHVLYGEPVAILAGDAMLSTSFQHVAQNTPRDKVAAEKILDVVVRLGQSVGAKGLAGGQVMDLDCEGRPMGEVSLEDLTWIHTHKTATLLQVAVACGAILGGASEEDVERLEKFALDVGLAFQVADDILDVTQSSEQLGKTAGKDEDTDKTTYPRLMGLDGSKAEAKRLVEEAKGFLEPYGEKALPLLAIADYIIYREN